MATSRSSTHPAHRQPWIQAQYEERDSGCEIGGRKHRIPRPEHRRRHRSRGDELDGCVILMFDAQPGWAPTPAHLRVYVKTRKSRSILRLLCGAREVTRVTRSGFRAPRRGQPGQAEHGSSSSRNASNAFRRLDPGTVAMPGTGSLTDIPVRARIGNRGVVPYGSHTSGINERALQSRRRVLRAES